MVSKSKKKTVEKKVVEKKERIVNDDFEKSVNFNQIVLNFTDKEFDDIDTLNMIISVRNRKTMSRPVISKIIFNQGLRHYHNLIKSYRERKGWSEFYDDD